MSNDDRDAFERRASALLRASADDLDATTRTHLARARALALEPRAASRNLLDFRYLAPAGATAAAVLATVFYFGQDPASVNGQGPAALDDMELLADADALELSQETDLDFIEWAAAMGPAAVGG